MGFEGFLVLIRLTSLFLFIILRLHRALPGFIRFILWVPHMQASRCRINRSRTAFMVNDESSHHETRFLPCFLSLFLPLVGLTE